YFTYCISISRASGGEVVHRKMDCTVLNAGCQFGGCVLLCVLYFVSDYKKSSLRKCLSSSTERECVCVCVCVCVCESVCVSERESGSVCVCECERERE